MMEIGRFDFPCRLNMTLLRVPEKLRKASSYRIIVRDLHEEGLPGRGGVHDILDFNDIMKMIKYFNRQRRLWFTTVEPVVRIEVMEEWEKLPDNGIGWKKIDLTADGLKRSHL